MTIQEAVEKYNRLNADIDDAVKLNDRINKVRADAANKPMGEIVITRDDTIYIQDVISYYIRAKREELKDEFKEDAKDG